MVANICYCHKCMVQACIVNLMHAFLCNVCNAFSYTTQDERGSKLLRQNKTKTSVFTNYIDNVSLRLFYNWLPLPRMCYVLVSNGWLHSRSNGNIRKSACAGERHVFGIWDIGQFHHPYSKKMSAIVDPCRSNRDWFCEPTKLVFAVTPFLGDITRCFETGHVFQIY